MPTTPADIDYAILPEGLRDGMKRYIDHGIRPGHFLTAVLENDFLGAFKRADDTSTRAMHQIASFIYNEAPMTCCGSPEKVKAWIERHAEERARGEVAAQ